MIRSLASITGSLDDAEEYAAVAFARAAAHPGPIADLPAWCVTAGRRAWIDAIRRQAVGRRLATQLAADPTGGPDVDGQPPGADGLDDRVALLFVACDEALPPVGQMVLALRLVCGLSVPQIAAHLGMQDAAVAARLTRAKRLLATARGAFRLADEAERALRLPMVLACVAGMHNQGHRGAIDPADAAADISRQALSIADSLVALYPADPETRGMRAVIRLALARRPGRIGPDGSALALAEVDRSRWDRQLLRDGLADAAVAAAAVPPGRFALEAAISGKHCVADDLARTDWAGIEVLYGELGRRWPSPAVTVAALIARSHRLRYAGNGGEEDREVESLLTGIVEQGPAYASRDAALALADLDWHAGRWADAAARYADLAELLDGPMRAFCLRRAREAAAAAADG